MHVLLEGACDVQHALDSAGNDNQLQITEFHIHSARPSLAYKEHAVIAMHMYMNMLTQAC